MSKIGRNDLCPCGSSKKYKKCCYSKDRQDLVERLNAKAQVSKKEQERLEITISPDNGDLQGVLGQKNCNALKVSAC